MSSLFFTISLVRKITEIEGFDLINPNYIVGKIITIKTLKQKVLKL